MQWKKMMTKEEIFDIAKEAGFLSNLNADYIISPNCADDADLSEELKAFAKLIAEKAIEPYLPYKQHIETMERAFDAHFKKARGQE